MMRAVDRPEQAIAEGRRRLKPGGWLFHLRGRGLSTGEIVALPGMAAGTIEILKA